MLKELEGYDWEEAFKYASSPEAVPPGASVPNGGFSRDDVKRIIKSVEGENDTSDWVVACELNDGRFAALRAGCDYTGWDCRAGGSANVAATEAELIRFGLSNQERERLGIEQPKD